MIWHDLSARYFSKGTRTSLNPYWQPAVSRIHASLANNRRTFNTVYGISLESGPGTSFVGISGFPIRMSNTSIVEATPRKCKS